jgi:hypothetical protein
MIRTGLNRKDKWYIVCSAVEANTHFCSGNVKDIASAIRYASHHVEFRDCPACGAPAGPHSCLCVQWEAVSDRSYEHLSKKEANFKMRFEGNYESFIRSCYFDPITSTLAIVPGVAQGLSLTSWVDDQATGVADMSRLLIQDGLAKYVPASLNLMPPIERESYIDLLTSKCRADAISAATISNANSNFCCPSEPDISLLLASGCCDSLTKSSFDGGSSSTASHIVPRICGEVQQRQFLVQEGIGTETKDQDAEDVTPLPSGTEQEQLAFKDNLPLPGECRTTPPRSSLCSQKQWLKPTQPTKIVEAPTDCLEAPNSPSSTIVAAATAAAACASAAVYRAVGLDPETMSSQPMTYVSFPWHAYSAVCPVVPNVAPPGSTSPPQAPALAPAPHSAGQPTPHSAVPLTNEKRAKMEESARKAHARKLRNREAALRSNKTRSEKYKKLISDVTKRREDVATLQKQQAALRAENARLHEAAGLALNPLAPVKSPSSFPPLSPASEKDDAD